MNADHISPSTGRRSRVPAGTTVFDAARMNGIPIPTLCHQQNETPVGGVPGLRGGCGRRASIGVVHAASAKPNMVVKTNLRQVQAARRTLVELLMADHPSALCPRSSISGDCELESLSQDDGRDRRRALPNAPSACACQGRLLAQHRRGSLGVHPVRPLHPRLRRDSPQLRDRAAGQRLSPRPSLSIPICPWAIRPACLAANAWCPALRARSPTRSVVGQHLEQTKATLGRRCRNCCSCRCFKSVSGTFLELNKDAVVKRHFQERARSSAAKANTVPRRSTFWKATVDILSRRRVAHVNTDGRTRTVSSSA